MKLNKLIVLVFSISILASLCAQGTWTVYTKDDGLTSNKIYQMQKDSNGNLWFNTTYLDSDLEPEPASARGVMMYDGQNWTNYYSKKSLGSVNIIFEDSKGTVWLGTNVTGALMLNGLMRINGSSFEKISKVGAKWIVEDYDGKIWFGAKNLGSYDGNSVIKYSKKEIGEKKITALYCDNAGNLWVGTKKGVSIFDGNKWRVVSNELNCPTKQVNSIISDSNNNIWLGAEDGVFRYDSNKWDHFSTKDGLIADAILLIKIDSHNNIYASAGKPMKTTGLGVVDLKRAISSDLAKKGLSIFENGGWRAFSNGEGVPDNLKPMYFEDRSGNLWFNTYDNTIYMFNGENWTSFDESNGFKARDFSAILEDSKGNHWFGLDNGLGKFDGQNWKYFTKDSGMPSNSITSIIEDDDGNIWFGTLKGIVKYSP